MAAESSSNKSDRPGVPKPPAPTDWVEAVRQQVSSLRFGVIQIVVHEGRVVQIDRAEKIRVDSKS